MPNKRVNDSSEKFINYQPFNVIRKEANYQAHAIIGGMAPSYKDEERISMTLINEYLGWACIKFFIEYFTSRKTCFGIWGRGKLCSLC